MHYLSIIIIILILIASVGNCLVSKSASENIILISDSYDDYKPMETDVDKYEATWESLESRPLPPWFDQVKVGVFITWGVFSVPSVESEWFLYYSKTNGSSESAKYMRENYPAKFTYQDFARDFTAEFYDPYRWVETFKKAGIKYVVFVSKHCDGFTLWPSKYSYGWNAGDVGPNRDVLGELATAIRNSSDIRLGLYHSWYEWFNPLYLKDKRSGFKTQEFVEYKAYPELVELVNVYKPELIWSDGDEEASDDYWKSKEFLAWLYNSSPVKETVIVNDRWGNGTACKHGGYWACQDRYNPGVLVSHKWENAMTIDRTSWGFRRNAPLDGYLSPEEIIEQLVCTVACGGNFLINIGPTKDGIIPAIYEERLLQMGKWLEANGEAIYETTPWKVAQNDSKTSGVWYTMKKNENKVFAIVLDKAWPLVEDGEGKVSVLLGSVDYKVLNIRRIRMLGYKKDILWVPCDGIVCKNGVLVTLPNYRSISNRYAVTFVIYEGI